MSAVDIILQRNCSSLVSSTATAPTASEYASATTTAAAPEATTSVHRPDGRAAPTASDTTPTAAWAPSGHHTTATSPASSSDLDALLRAAAPFPLPSPPRHEGDAYPQWGGGTAGGGGLGVDTSRGQHLPLSPEVGRVTGLGGASLRGSGKQTGSGVRQEIGVQGPDIIRHEVSSEYTREPCAVFDE